MSISSVSGLSVVIPNYNGRQLFPEILPSLFLALQNSKLPYEVIISDDRSTDESIAYLSANYPAIQVLINEQNLGFGPTINRGIRAATLSHVLLLNSDVKLSANYFSRLTAYFQEEECFGVMSRIIGWNDDKIQDGGKYPSFHGLKIKTSGNYVPEDPASTHRFYSMYLSGANALVDREKLLLLNGFNELFAPFYIEDFELSIRAWRIGWKCYYDDQTWCRHQESVTIRSKEKANQIKKIYYRNKMYLHALHLPAMLVPLWWIQLLIEGLVNIITLRFYFIGSLIQYCCKLSTIHKQRREFHALCSSMGRSPLSLLQASKIVLKNVKGQAVRQF